MEAAAFEEADILGMLSSDWFTSRFSGGRATRVCPVYMAGCVGSLVLFWGLPHAGPWVSVTLLCLSGFFIYGPQRQPLRWMPLLWPDGDTPSSKRRLAATATSFRRR